MRAAMGAGRARIIRQLLTESLVLAALGGGLGLLLGYLGLGVLLSFIPPNVPRLQDVSLDTHVFLFTALISILTGVLFGLVPAWQASKVNLAEALKDAGRSNSAGRGIRSHSLLVTAEVALVAILLVGAGLMLQSFQRLMAVDPGFKPQGVAAFHVLLPWSRYSKGEQRDQFFEQARSQLGSLPGVRAVGAVSQLPLSGNESMNVFSVEGAEPVPRGKEPLVEDRVITPGYFEAMGVSFVSGRDFNAADSAGKLPVVIVNEQLARQFFPEGDCIGKRIKRTLDDKEWKTIIGIVRDVRGFALEVQARPQFYHPHAQDLERDEMAMVLRADEAALPSLRSAVQQKFKQLDATVPVANYPHNATTGIERRGASAIHHAIAWLVRGDGIAVDRRRALRRCRLRSQSTNARNRHSHGAGRATAKRVVAGHWPGHTASACRISHRDGGRIRVDTSASQSALRSESRRPADVYPSCDQPVTDRMRRLLRASAASNKD